MMLVLSPLMVVGGLGIVVVLSVLLVCRVRLTFRDLVVLLLGFVVVAVAVFDWSGLVSWSMSVVHALHSFAR